MIRITTILFIVQSLGHGQLFASPGTGAHQASLSFTIFQSLLKLISVEAIQPSHPLSSPSSPPSVFPRIRVFSNESTFHIRWPKYWRFSFSKSSSNEYSGLISFRIYWFYLPVEQGILKSILQHHNSKASILWYSAFIIVQLSHPYMTTGNTTALTQQTFAGKVMALFFNMLPKLVIVFLPRSKHLLISWLW